MTIAFTPLRYLEVSLITLAIVAGCELARVRAEVRAQERRANRTSVDLR